MPEQEIQRLGVGGLTLVLPCGELRARFDLACLRTWRVAELS